MSILRRSAFHPVAEPGAEKDPPRPDPNEKKQTKTGRTTDTRKEVSDRSGKPQAQTSKKLSSGTKKPKRRKNRDYKRGENTRTERGLQDPTLRRSARNLNVSLSVPEAQAIRDAAKARGMQVSAYVRLMLFDEGEISRPHPERNFTKAGFKREVSRLSRMGYKVVPA